ncbi:MAG: dihydropteroate synthase [Chloroflexi bacterium]|nr:dihydropteroate synthase [Chloroflexota bacterium]
MTAIGESIHVISPAVRTAIESRDKKFIQDLAMRQISQGADMLDLNIGPQKKTGPEVMDWMVKTVQEVTDVPLSLDTTNPLAIEAGLKAVKGKALINSTDATPERLSTLMPLAARYGQCIIALTYGGKSLPTSVDQRVELAVDKIVSAAAEHGVSMENVYLDPLVLTINGNQDQALQTIEAIRCFKQMIEPPPLTTCGLSNISNSCPNDLRPLINEVFLVMMLGAGLDAPIVDVFDSELMRISKVIESRDTSSAVNKVYLDIYDTYAAGGRYEASGADMSDPKVSAIVKTCHILEGKSLYAHGYLKL